ncbi:MAG: hypothetical protein U0324_02585 [Polyangiales bacterium]
MKRLQRTAPPPRIDPARAESVARLLAWYGEADGRDHWNDVERGERPVREALRALSGDRCAWCEAALGALLEVEHYLPQSHFPHLRYCWLNLLPACGLCNGAKLTWYPPELLGRALIDPCLQGTCAGDAYVPASVLAEIDDRLIEPTFDDPAEHLVFSPVDCTWTPKTGVGERTIKKLLSDRSYTERMQRLSELAREFVRHGAARELVEIYLGLHGHETVFAALLAYWRQFYPPRINPL